MQQFTPEQLNCIDTVLGYVVRRTRQQTGMSRAFLARRLGITITELKSYEDGSAPISAAQLYAMSRIFERSPDWMFITVDDAGYYADKVRSARLKEALDELAKLDGSDMTE